MHDYAKPPTSIGLWQNDFESIRPEVREKINHGQCNVKTSFSLICAVFFLIAGGGAQAGLQEGINAYEKGNYPVALKKLKPLAAKGNAVAQNALGFMYANGQGVPQDYKKAMEWYRKAAEQGFASAQSNLGVMYAEGRGVGQDDRERILVQQGG